MRRQLLAMASSAALGLAISASGPAGAIQPTPGLGNAADANVIQVRDRGNDGGRGGGQGFSRGGGGGGGAQMSIRGGGDGGRGMSRGNFSAPRGNFQTGGGSRGNFSAQGGKFEARGQVQSKSIQSGGNFEPRGDSRNFNKKDFSQKNFDKKEFSSQKNFDKNNLPRGEARGGDWDKKDWNKKDWDKKDFSRWKGNRPHLAHRGWDRHHKHRFFGAFLIGVPFGYATISAHPCYDWIYGPQGWGYYWSYDRCPV